MLGRVIRDISRFALVKVDQGSNSLQIHRLVQAVIRSQMSDEERVEARHEVHKILAGARPRQGETDDPANWSTYDIIWPHLGPVRGGGMRRPADPPAAHRLGALPVEARRVRVLPEPGQPAGEPVDPPARRRITRRPCTCSSRSPTCCAPRAASARPAIWTRMSWNASAQVLGPDHPHTLMTANGLGADLRALGEFQEALASDRQTYESFKEQFGEDYPRTLLAAHNLAVLAAAGRGLLRRTAAGRGDAGPPAAGAGPRASQHPPVRRPAWPWTCGRRARSGSQ